MMDDHSYPEQVMENRTFSERTVGAAKLDSTVYDEVENDLYATRQTGGVVAIVSACSAVGVVAGGVGTIMAGLVSALLGWLLWAGVTCLIGDQLPVGTATWGGSFAPSDSPRLPVCFTFSPGALFAGSMGLPGGPVAV